MLALLALAALPLARLASAELIEAGKAEYDSLLKSGKTFMALLYAPWCGHCKAFKPQFNLAGEQLTIADFVRIDCTDQENGGAEVCNANGVQGYPTVKLFNPADSDSPIEYRGPREAEPVKSFVMAHLRKPFRQLSNVEELKTAFAELKEESVAGQETTFFFVTKNKAVSSLVFKLANEVEGSARVVVLPGAGKNALAALEGTDLAEYVGEGFSAFVVKGGEVSKYAGENKGDAIRAWMAEYK